MGNFNYVQKTKLSDPMPLDNTGQNSLKLAAPWAKFIAICGFICCGVYLLRLLIVLLSSQPSYNFVHYDIDFGATVITYIIVIAAIIVSFVISLNLFSFAEKAKHALLTQDSNTLNQCFDSLRKYFKISGVVIIVSLALVVLSMILFIIADALGARPEDLYHYEYPY